MLWRTASRLLPVARSSSVPRHSPQNVVRTPSLSSMAASTPQWWFKMRPVVARLYFSPIARLLDVVHLREDFCNSVQEHRCFMGVGQLTSKQVRLTEGQGGRESDSPSTAKKCSNR